ncbi:uncharacterized protein LOC110229626 [Arabidopsis lyrata subsp. lyrata]|uniref:uncharacterized protein LOC110229626 n=1 Tax=Arabidopsis lyrata subsp. lyrata TaxID=81972 RepID=UPI000A29E930|nr:uncharacterized protein LOC110229626 [Arabidopsis lyrata subsp. lyrata]|eukprot:XP_020885854.1 uncharacterized protein LOC110229626 [Arabidopsis lyrata subsp. lyrata]
MILSPRSGGYRIFLNPLSPYPLFTELIHVQIINFRDYFHTLNALKLRSGYFLYVLSRLQALCGILNLHGIAHVREDPPVLLRLYTHILRTLVLASSGILRYEFLCLKDRGLMLLNPPCRIFDGGFGSFSNDHSSSSSSDVFKLYVFNTTSFCYVLSKLNSNSTTILASNVNHQSTITYARTFVKALLCVVLLVPARFKSLAPSPTPSRLLTVAICSSIDLFLEELSINFDLTCTKKLFSFWLKALKDPLSINLIYPFIFLMVTLGYAPYYCALNFGISDPFYLCIWLLL